MNINLTHREWAIICASLQTTIMAGEKQEQLDDEGNMVLGDVKSLLSKLQEAHDNKNDTQGLVCDQW